jgi:hypothetical protein
MPAKLLLTPIGPRIKSDYSSIVCRTRCAITAGSSSPANVTVTLESVRSRDEHAESTIERVGGDPCFMWSTRVPATSDNRRLDSLAAITGNTFDVEDRDRHTA